MTSTSTENGAQVPTVPLPPKMAEMQSKGIEQTIKEMNRMPLFMTTLDETDGEGGENIALEALKSLQFEGTRAEIAENMRQEGNECARAKKWSDAKELYDKAIAALKALPQQPDIEDGPKIIELEDVDEEAEAKKEKAIEEACYVNRALCNLEKQNYGSCIRDCASALRLNPSNIKAFYRSAMACLALDKIPEALDACERGLQLEPSNKAIAGLLPKINARKAHIESVEKVRREREEKAASERATLRLALKSRGIPTKTTDQAPDLDDAAIKLENALDPSSALSFPVMLLYPVHAQSDFIKAFSEKEKLEQHLDYIFPLPWDEEKEYTSDGVEAYMETPAGGLVKAGKRMALSKILGSGKVEVVDGLVKISIVPRAKVAEWIEEFKRRRGG